MAERTGPKRFGLVHIFPKKEVQSGPLTDQLKWFVIGLVQRRTRKNNFGPNSDQNGSNESKIFAGNAYQTVVQQIQKWLIQLNITLIVYFIFSVKFYFSMGSIF